MRVLVVGSGGREHALAWKLSRSSALTELHAAPGNPGIAALAECHPIRADDAEGVLGLARSLAVDLVVVGPEVPLVIGLADALRRFGHLVFGPGAAAARIEGSKSFAKDVMAAAGVGTAARLPIARAPCVLKADGLAAGKGVHVCRTQAEVDAALPTLQRVAGEILVEELLEGPEVSLFAVCDGRDAVSLASAQDFKRALDGDAGPNTGGMGAWAPVLDGDVAESLVAKVHRPVLEELARRGAPFVGVLYAGLMLTEDGPRVLEFNCRFGDPEAQAILPLLETDLLEVLASAARGDLHLPGGAVAVSSSSAVTVVVAAADYPAGGDRGSEITGIEEAEAAGALVFHAGTARHGERLVTNGGRILAVTGVGATVGEARAVAYRAVDRVAFAGMRFRSDIAARAAAGITVEIDPLPRA